MLIMSAGNLQETDCQILTNSQNCSMFMAADERRGNMSGRLKHVPILPRSHVHFSHMVHVSAKLTEKPDCNISLATAQARLWPG